MSVIAQPMTTAITRSGYMAATQREYEPAAEIHIQSQRDGCLMEFCGIRKIDQAPYVL